MKIAIVGGGRIARIHSSVILKQPNTRIVGVADRDLARARSLAVELNDTAFYSDAETMIREQHPDIVHVLTPPPYHCDLSVMAMQHGCHVFVEKPLALTMAEAKRMVEAAKQNRVRLCVDHNFLFDDVVLKARETYAKGLLGELVSVEAHVAYNARRYPGLLDEGAELTNWLYQLPGGLLQDWMPHPASMIVEFLPSIQDVHFVTLNRGIMAKGWPDEIRVSIASERITGYIHISLSERPDIFSLTLRGTKGIAHANLFNQVFTFETLSALPRAAARSLSGFHLARQNIQEATNNIVKFVSGKMDATSGIGRIIPLFYTSVRNGTETPISLDKSLRVVELISRIWPQPSSPRQPNTTPPSVRALRPTVLVTGGSGFIGSHLVKRLLDEGTAVRVLVRPNSVHAGRLKKLNVDIFEGDLSDPEALCAATQGIQTIYHIGATMSGGWEQHYEGTVRGTEYLIKAAQAHQVKRFVHISSVVVYDLLDAKPGAIIGEDTPYQRDPKAMGPYAYSKLEAEKRVLDAYRHQGLPATVIRPGMVIGPMGRLFFPHFGYRYSDRLFLPIGSGDLPLPLTYIENTVDGIYRASIVDKAIGQAYNLVDDGQITVKEYLEWFVRATNRQSRIIAVPYFIPYIASAMYELAAQLNLVKPGVTSRKQLKWKQAHVYFDNTKAKRDLDWRPRVSLVEGLTTTFLWYAKNVAN